MARELFGGHRPDRHLHPGRRRRLPRGTARTGRAGGVRGPLHPRRRRPQRQPGARRPGSAPARSQRLCGLRQGGRGHRRLGRLTKRCPVALWPTAEGRARAVQAYRDSRRAEQARHQEREGAWHAPRSESVRRLVAEAFVSRPQQPYEDGGDVVAADAVTGVDGLSEDEGADLEARARGGFMCGETTLVTSTVDEYGREAAERRVVAGGTQSGLRHRHRPQPRSRHHGPQQLRRPRRPRQGSLLTLPSGPAQVRP